MSIPLSQNEIIKVLIEQADFRIEGHNLRKFSNNFEGLQDLISVPDIYYESEDLLIENYIDNSKGKSIQD
jgi:predicted unusual protein kinase regulating ubiquinone biosynthesis (AarF/ABC1/UbiB family)